jgi:outer membrane murein-binding lipoprotein Lpp
MGVIHVARSPSRSRAILRFLGPLLFAALLAACEPRPEGPASVGSPSSQGAALAAEIERLTVEIRQAALAVQAASDPEQRAAGGPPPDLEASKAQLARIKAQRDALEEQLARMERLASGE